MDYSQDLSSDYLQIYAHKIGSIAHTTAAEERALWRKYIKWRHLEEILDSESALHDIPTASPIVVSKIIKEISSSQDIIVLLRHHVGLDKLGDTIIEDDDNNTNLTIELYRRIQHSRKRHDEKIEQNNSETCCLEDLFGYILGETLNNIAFGKGNPNLVYKIAKVINREPTYIKDKLFELAVNRELLPKGMINFWGKKIPLNKLPELIQSIPPDFFSELVSNYYQSFILNIKSEGEKAFNRIIESHLWLVIDIVKKYVNNNLNLPQDDLIQEGNLGLIEAAKKFQPTLSRRFMQYAYPWIYHRIDLTTADKARDIRVLDYEVETTNRLLKTSRRLAQEYGREPSAEEISERMDLPLERVKVILEVEQLLVSPEAHIDEDEDNLLDEREERPFGNPLIDVIDENALLMTDAVVERSLKEQIEGVLHTLTHREQRVLQLRFGLDGGRRYTLEEVGQEFKLTRERIRQIQDKALRRLRHPSRSRKLKDYLE